MATKNRPGILLYFEIIEPLLTQLSDEQAGRLFRAAFAYGQYGVVPSFPGGDLLSMAWALLKPAIDRDGERYSETVIQRSYAVYVRDAKRNGQEPMSFEAFKANGRHQPTSTDNENIDRHRPITDDNGRYPNTNTTTITKANTITTTTPTTATKANKGELQPYVQQIADRDEFDYDCKGDVNCEKLANDNPYVAEKFAVIEDNEDDFPF